MKNQYRKLFGQFIFALLALTVSVAAPAANWEVAVVFLSGQEPEDFQNDIDWNILELARTHPNDKFSLSISRDIGNRTIQYFLTPETAKNLVVWDPLFFDIEKDGQSHAQGIQIPGDLTELQRKQGKSLLDEPAMLQDFFKRAFQQQNSKRVLVVYAHGEAYKGFTVKRLLDFKEALQENLPNSPQRKKAFDIMWLDSCFMGNIEALYQLKTFADYFVTSQDAEFSTAMPFDILSDLEAGPENSREVAVEFAKRFIESYSFILQGTQTKAVLKSAATINVIDAEKIEGLLPDLKQLALAFNKQELAKIETKRLKIAMDKTELLDLGQLVKLSKLVKIENAESSSRNLMQILEIGKPRKLKTNPRIKIRPQIEDSFLQFGFNNWTKGMKSDQQTAEILNKTNLKPSEYLKGSFPGSRGRIWPIRPLHKQLYVSPFFPGANVFNLIFLDPLKKIPNSRPYSYQRTRDYYEYPATQNANPVIYSAYTQSVGTHSEKYTGLNISDPSLGVPTLEYRKNDFFLKTQWGLAK